MHARKTARDALFPSREDDAFFSPRRGDIVFQDSTSVRTFADRVNRTEGREGPERLQPAELSAMALVHGVLHAVIGRYRAAHGATFDRLASSLEASLGDLRRTHLTFLGTFPPPPVYRTLRGEADEPPHRYLEGLPRVELDEELLLLWVTSQNPAYTPVRGIVGDHGLGPLYRAYVSEAVRFFVDEPKFGPKGETLLDLLLAPSRAHPTSIFAQLEYMKESWVEALGLQDLPVWDRLKGLADLRAEEAKWFQKGGPGPGEPLLEPMRFGQRGGAEEPARFSPDLNWMPNVVLIAKTVYVWLDQLSKKYGRHIHRLDHVPDEELDLLAARNINGLWLIGLFERSAASRKVKQMRGDQEALASAYSLAGYQIAHELGGVPAYADLRMRAQRRGIRLGADMVPNHVGIDAEWVMNHPEWFLQTKTPPFPSYRFGGPNLSEDSRVSVFLEEGYWNKTDAAVVFRRHDRRSGDDRYIYHGNDGTSMPWNDTAQLDYLRAEVRHAVIETILHVARMFPIIRFDAAMTLAKRHIQRLWFPLPGQGGAIPSRSDYAMTQEEFDAAIPNEFWRDVVDAVAERAPDTLLLAEAFWMMEGYFVRTLGMHRVYNSAFMNTLKREENAKYRETIKNVLDFDPEILKRFVNFMNNPDEETAVAQFGESDRYFGVCLMMCTMPGLPMIGHGQIEGLHEKYGMEYRRPRYDEHPNQELVARHEREVFPVLEKRYLFSGSAHFALYDFISDDGSVDEDVYAYSNGAGSERALVLFNNRFKAARGRIHRSTHRGTLGRELLIDEDAGAWLVLRDAAHKLDYLAPTQDVIDGGLVWELGAFKYQVLTSFRPVNATVERPYHRLAAELAGRGVPDVEHALRELYLRPVHAPLREACSQGHLAFLASQLDAPDSSSGRAALEEKLAHAADGLDWMLTERTQRDVTVDRAAALRSAGERFAALHQLLGGGEENIPTEPNLPPVSSVKLLPDEKPTEESLPDDEEEESAAAAAPAPAAASAPAVAATADAVDGAAAPPAQGARFDVDLFLSWIQIEAVADLLGVGAAAVDEARSRPPPYLSTMKGGATPGDAVALGTPEAPAEPVKPASPTDVTWAGREAILEEWELATPLIEAFATARDYHEARRRAALVLLGTTLPLGPVGPALRLAIGTKRGQAYLDIHHASGALWLRKERFEELVLFLAEREQGSGRLVASVAAAEIASLNELARAEGYRAERIAAKLGPAPSEDTPLLRLEVEPPTARP